MLTESLLLKRFSAGGGGLRLGIVYIGGKTGHYLGRQRRVNHNLIAMARETLARPGEDAGHTQRWNGETHQPHGGHQRGHQGGGCACEKT
jgi:hypothetical protein